MIPMEVVFTTNLILMAIACIFLWLGRPRHHHDPGDDGFNGFGKGILFAVCIVWLVKDLAS